jgi:hypothetical protein
MNKRIEYCLCTVVLLATALGCGPTVDSSNDDNISITELTTQMDKKPKPAAAAPAAPAPTASDAATAASDNAAPGARAEPPDDDDRDSAPADAQVAGERPAVRSTGYVGAIASANRNVRQRLDSVAWQKSVQLFEAEKGYKPRTTEEFLERVRSEGTPIPEIPPGHTYLYVPEEGQFGELYQVLIGETPSDAPAAGK